jgi:hypothetical protein
MIEGETTQAMFDRFMTLINKIRALGETRWDDNSTARKICRVYRQKNNMLASVIMERDNYTTMTPQEMLAKLMHHEVLDDEAKEESVLKKSIPSRHHMEAIQVIATKGVVSIGITIMMMTLTKSKLC